MEKIINVAELLKDCPKGMELDSPIWNNIVFEEINGNSIVIFRKSVNAKVYLTRYGEFNRIDGKCVIFPKGKTTWEGFVPPVEFKDGDIIFTHANCLKVGLGNTWISIFQEKRNGGVATYVDYAEDGDDFYSYNEDKALLCMEEDIMRQRFATEEEKARLFQAIKDNGYNWNPETKTLEKLVQPKFKVGDRVKHISACTQGIVVKVNDKGYHIDYPKGEGVCYVSFTLEKDYELAPNKFDINTLVPFESRVLVRAADNQFWRPAIWGVKHCNWDYYCVLGGDMWEQCIPYEGNEHLLGNIDDCDEFYKNWT